MIDLTAPSKAASIGMRPTGVKHLRGNRCRCPAPPQRRNSIGKVSRKNSENFGTFHLLERERNQVE